MDKFLEEFEISFRKENELIAKLSLELKERLATEMKDNHLAAPKLLADLFSPFEPDSSRKIPDPNCVKWTLEYFVGRRVDNNWGT